MRHILYSNKDYAHFLCLHLTQEGIFNHSVAKKQNSYDKKMLDSINIHYIYTFVQCLSNKETIGQIFQCPKASYWKKPDATDLSGIWASSPKVSDGLRIPAFLCWRNWVQLMWAFLWKSKKLVRRLSTALYSTVTYK